MRLGGQDPFLRANAPRHMWTCRPRPSVCACTKIAEFSTFRLCVASRVPRSYMLFLQQSCCTHGRYGIRLQVLQQVLQTSFRATPCGAHSAPPAPLRALSGGGVGHLEGRDFHAASLSVTLWWRPSRSFQVRRTMHVLNARLGLARRTSTMTSRSVCCKRARPSVNVVSVVGMLYGHRARARGIGMWRAGA